MSTFVFLTIQLIKNYVIYLMLCFVQLKFHRSSKQNNVLEKKKHRKFGRNVSNDNIHFCNLRSLLLINTNSTSVQLEYNKLYCVTPHRLAFTIILG